MTLNHLAVTTTEADAAGAGAARHTGRVAVELPTLLIALVTYGGWLAITFAYSHWPLAIVAPIAAVLSRVTGRTTSMSASPIRSMTRSPTTGHRRTGHASNP